MSAHLSIFHVGVGLINFIFINYCPPIFEPQTPSIDCFTIGTWLNLRVKRKWLISQLRKKHSCLCFYCAKNLTELENESKKANISVCQKSCSIAFLLYQSHLLFMDHVTNEHPGSFYFLRAIRILRIIQRQK